MWFSWNKAEIIFEFCDIILYSSANLQSFYLLYHVLNRGQDELYKKALFNFVYFVNYLAILLQNFLYIKPKL